MAKKKKVKKNNYQESILSKSESIKKKISKIRKKVRRL